MCFICRRSYNTAPPSPLDKDFINSIGIEFATKQMQEMNPNYLDHSMRKTLSGQFKLKNLQESLDYLYPWTESLQKCEERAYGYWLDVIAPEVRKNKRVLIVAHANTIRSLVKAIDNISDDKIARLRIPNGIPLVYTLDADLNPVETETSDDIGFQANYLVSPYNHKKIMKYETCVSKKLRSLFEYFI